MKIGIFGGTFDPFTVAHRAIAEKVLEENIVDKIVILPTVVDYYRKDKTKWLTDNEKTACITRFIQKSNYFGKIDICTAEFYLKYILPDDKIATRRSVHMVENVKTLYGRDNEYYYIIGTDSLKNFKTWYMWEDLLKMIKLIVVNGRDNENIESDIPSIKIVIPKKYANISASEIRRKYSDLNRYLEDILGNEEII